jgi:urease accessory protein
MRSALRDLRTRGQIGRHARLDLRFERRAGRTVVAHAYAEPPLRIGRAFDVDGAAYMILVTSGPGIFAGDCLHQSVTVGPGARVMLASQSALQVHPGDAPDAATVQNDYQVAEGGELHCHWDPVIPFSGARFSQRVNLRIAPDSRFYWSDGLMSGRASRGEAWQFRSIEHELRLDVGGQLRYLERYRLMPSDRPVHHPWRMGSADYVGTMLAHHDSATPAFAEELQRQIGAVEGVAAGIDLVEPLLLLARLLGKTGVAWSRARSLCRDRVLAAIFQSPSLVVRR